MKRKKFIRIVAIVLAILMLGSVFIGIFTAGASAVSKAELDKLKQQRKEIQQKQQELKSQINSLEYEQSTTLAKKRLLDEQVETTQNVIDNLTEQIDQYDVLIEEKGKAVEAARVEEEKQWDVYKTRIRAMEENGTISYYEILFNANSYLDLLSRIDCISEIMESDERMYERLVEARETTEAAKVQLENSREEQRETRDELEKTQADLISQVDEASAMLATLETNLDTYQTLYAEADAEEAEVQKQITKMESDLEKMKTTSTVKGTGSFIWPCNARTVTSTYGSRLHPIFKVYKFHSGIDVGASYGSNLCAADGGTVMTATYSNSYGYYVVINHGNGYSTLYAHMSKLYVKAGDTVKQGKIIGLSGSSGNSTGPHLHFEVRKNGSTVNPLQFYSNYVINE